MRLGLDGRIVVSTPHPIAFHRERTAESPKHAPVYAVSCIPGYFRI